MPQIAAASRCGAWCYTTRVLESKLLILDNVVHGAAHVTSEAQRMTFLQQVAMVTKHDVMNRLPQRLAWRKTLKPWPCGAGQGVGLVTQVQPAAEIIFEVANDARKCINNLVSTIK